MYHVEENIFLSWKYSPSKKFSQIIDFSNSISYYTNLRPNREEWDKLKLRFLQF